MKPSLTYLGDLDNGLGLTNQFTGYQRRIMHNWDQWGNTHTRIDVFKPDAEVLMPGGVSEKECKLEII